MLMVPIRMFDMTQVHINTFSLRDQLTKFPISIHLITASIREKQRGEMPTPPGFLLIVSPLKILKELTGT